MCELGRGDHAELSLRELHQRYVPRTWSVEFPDTGKKTDHVSHPVTLNAPGARVVRKTRRMLARSVTSYARRGAGRAPLYARFDLRG